MATDIGNNIVFVHIPKTGGVSIVKSIKGEDYSYHGGGSRHWRPAKYDSYKKYVTMVRNPYDRFVSGYEFNLLLLEQGETQPNYTRNLMPKITFDEFVLRFFRDGEKLIGPKLAFHKQVRWMYALNNDRISFDYVGRFENYQEAFNRICELSRNEVELRHDNATSHGEWIEYYNNKEVADAIYDYYKDDFEELKYERL